MDERLPDTAIVAQVRRRLEEQEGVPLPAGRAAVGKKADGSPRQHLFDLVAENGAIIGEVRTYTLGASGSRPAGKFAHCYAACLFLYRARARRKLLVLTDRAFWARFRREGEGLIEGIEVIHVPLDDLAPIATEDDAPQSASGFPAPPPPRPARPGGPYRAPGRPPRRDPGPRRDDDSPPPRRNKGGPGPRGRHPNTGPRRRG